MNTAPWPLQQSIPTVNPNAKTDAEMQHVLSVVNMLIQLVNRLNKQLAGVHVPAPFTGENESGYITNFDLLNWPATVFQIGANISGTNYPQLVMTPGSARSPGTTILKAAAGAFEADGGFAVGANIGFSGSTGGGTLAGGATAPS